MKIVSLRFRIPAMLMALFLPTAVSALQVTNTNDSGPGSLRQAIIDSAPGGTIDFAPGLSGHTIVLSAPGSLLVDKALTIEATGLSGGINIKALPAVNDFAMEVSVGGILSLNKVHVIDSAYGGIWVNGGSLTMSDCKVTGNSCDEAAAGIEIWEGVVTISDCLLAGNQSLTAGAINNLSGDVTLVRTTISGNSLEAAPVGGILNGWDGDLYIAQCTIDGNVVSGLNTGAIENHGTLQIRQSTLSGNQGNVGAIDNFGELILSECTISGNAGEAAVSGSVGGIRQSSFFGTLILNNTIVAGNSGTLEANISGSHAGTDNLIGGNPLLAPLGDYGGPTRTMPPLRGSPAIDAGGSLSIHTDQRGSARWRGAEVDIGSVEAYLDALVINATDNALRGTVAEVTPGAIIRFHPDLSDQTIQLSSGQIPINWNLTIDASDLDYRVRIDGGGLGRIFEVAGGVTLSLDHLALFNGNAHTGGCVFNNGGTLLVNRCTFFQSSAVNLGGAIYNLGAATVQNSTFFSNTANLGGAICSSGSLSVDQSTFFSNTAEVYGGGITIMSGSAVLRHVTVSRNEAQEGGGIKNFASLTADNTIVAGNTVITADPEISGAFSGANNLTSGDPLLALLGDYGGPTLTMLPLPGSPAIDAAGPTPFSFDQRGEHRDPVPGGPAGFVRTVGPAPDIGAVESGNAVPSISGVVTLETDDFDGIANGLSLREALSLLPPGSVITFAAALSGKTIQLTDGQLLLDRNLEIDASALPGGLTIAGTGQSRLFEIPFGLTVSLKSLIMENGGGVEQGGAIFNSGSLTVDRCWIRDNSATLAGGGVYNGGSTLILNRSTVSGNSATTAAGIHNFGSVTADHCTIAGNIASSIGGGIFNYGFLSFNHCTLTKNSATQGGGIFQASGFMNLDRSILGGNANQQQGLDVEGNFAGSDNLMSSQPLLAPLGNYGGLVPTMPPLPGSPAINAAANSPSNMDQRGLGILDFPDIGASEFQGASDVGIFWNLDFDGDGLPYGVEQALGTDVFAPDLNNSRNLAPPVRDPSGKQTLSFGLNPAALPGTVWILSRSQNLVDFTEIYRFDGSADFAGTDVDFDRDPDRVVIIDTAPPPGRAFYRFETRFE